MIDKEKLAKLSNIEKKLGHDLVILLTAMTDGIYVVQGSGKIEYMSGADLWLREGMFGYGWTYDPSFLSYKDYGKTEPGGWALTKKELEKKPKKIMDESSKYKETDERLGIDLGTFIEALLRGIFIKKADGTIAQELFPQLTFDDDLDGDRCYELMFLCKHADWEHIYLKDIGKTWALTKEALK